MMRHTKQNLIFQYRLEYSKMNILVYKIYLQHVKALLIWFFIISFIYLLYYIVITINVYIYIYIIYMKNFFIISFFLVLLAKNLEFNAVTPDPLLLPLLLLLLLLYYHYDCDCDYKYEQLFSFYLDQFYFHLLL